MRRDIWLTSDGPVWTVRARHGAGGREVSYDFDREYQARAMVDRLVKAAPGGWTDITRLVRKPSPAADNGARGPVDDTVEPA